MPEDRGSVANYIGGGDRAVPTVRPYSEPRKRKTTIEWGTPAPATPLPESFLEERKVKRASQPRRQSEHYGRTPWRVQNPGAARDIAEEYQAGATLKALSKKYGIAINTVRKCIVYHGVAIREKRTLTSADGARPWYEKNPELAAEIAKRYEAGEFIHILAKEYGIHHDTLSKVVVSQGVEIRKRGHNLRSRKNP